MWGMWAMWGIREGGTRNARGRAVRARGTRAHARAREQGPVSGATGASGASRQDETHRLHRLHHLVGYLVRPQREPEGTIGGQLGVKEGVLKGSKGGFGRVENRAVGAVNGPAGPI
jgi:hypothetical protein